MMKILKTYKPDPEREARAFEVLLRELEKARPKAEEQTEKPVGTHT
ncbi:MAG: hypothetical protein IT209_00605 [Armatimonadetes bacterium]|nr:hypothetical protein [Armatimonadota bacterium]